jgi:putative cell wall-binding protein/secreted trypsin-like serine protease
VRLRRAVATAIAVLVLASPALATGDEAPLPPGSATVDPVVPYLVGGTIAAPGAWPAMAALVRDGIGGGLEQFCGGTLIRTDLVVTAAHCTEAYLGAPGTLRVLLGRTDLSVSGGELVPAAAIVQHPGWDPFTYADDLAVIRLATPSPRPTAPIMVPGTEPDWSPGRPGTLVGWGATDASGSTVDPRLRQAAVIARSGADCRVVATYRDGLDLCAGEVGVGACFGDSGGPLFVADRTGATAVAGVVSRGVRTCGSAPGILTRIAMYAGWIHTATTSGATSRTAGADRYGTAAVLSSTFAPGVAVAYLATGEDFPDALAAAAAAGAAGGPVLLTRGDALPPATRAELVRLAPTRIVAVGGRAAISDGVLTAAAGATGVDAERVAGPDRYATAAALSATSHPDGAATAFVAVGSGFADAVAAGAVAGGAGGGPVLLTEPDRLSAATEAELRRLAPGRVVVLGGTSAIGAAVETAITAATGATVERIRGDDRYATAAALSAASFPTGAPLAYVATGTAFADALAAGPVAARAGVPLLLVPGRGVPAALRTELVRLGTRQIVVLGGPAAVSPATAWDLDGLLVADGG